MNPKKKSRRYRASVSIQALDLAISRFTNSLACTALYFCRCLLFNEFRFCLMESKIITVGVYIRGLQFYTFFGISTGITRRMIDIGKKITFYFLQNV
jgi:hypothetical protein